MVLTSGEKVLLGAVSIGFLHHVDHVLRVDHSGWPFVPQVTPLTYSLVAYPLTLLAFLLPRGSWLRAVPTALVFAFATFSHGYFETPYDQYMTWAHGSHTPGFEGTTNLLGLQSPVLGILAVLITAGLSFGYLWATMEFLGEARASSGQGAQS